MPINQTEIQAAELIGALNAAIAEGRLSQPEGGKIPERGRQCRVLSVRLRAGGISPGQWEVEKWGEGVTDLDIKEAERIVRQFKIDYALVG